MPTVANELNESVVYRLKTVKNPFERYKYG